MRSVIEYLKAEAASIPVQFSAKESAKSKDVTAQIAIISNFVGDSGMLGGSESRRVFEAKLFEDLLVVGAYATWYEQSRGGKLRGCYHVDAATIKPRIDAIGWPDPNIPFEQWIIGVRVAEFTAGDLRYDGMFPRPDTPYFDSAVEFAVSRILAGIKADDWNYEWLEGSTVHTGDALTLPSEWEPDEVYKFIDFWNQWNTNPATRQSTKFLPAGSTKIGDHSRKDQDFEAYEVQIIRRLCSVFGVQPASIGYVGEQYKVTQGDSMKASKRVGLGRMLALRKEFYDDLCYRLGCSDIECVNVEDDLDERKLAAEIAVAECGGPFKTVNEVRADNGLDPIDGGDVLPGAQSRETDDWDDDPEDDDQEDDAEDVGRAFNQHQPRDAKGRWIPIRTHAERASQLMRHGGFTYNLKHGNLDGKKMFSVAVDPHLTIRVPGKEVDPSVLENFIREHKAKLFSGEYNVGGWYNAADGMTYIDLSVLAKTKREGKALGLLHNQISIWDLEKRKEIKIGGTGR